MGLKKYFKPAFINYNFRGFGGGYMGLFLGDKSERRTGDKGKEKAENKR